jgi:hypothetical protein
MWVTLFLTLVLGMSLGILLDRFVLKGGESDEGSHDGRSRRERFIEHLDNELDLSPEQKASLEDVLAANRKKADAFWKETRSSYAELRKEFRQEIRVLFAPEQQKIYDQLLAAEDAKRKKRRQER